NYYAPVVNPKAFGLLEYGGTYEGAYLLRRGLFMPWELEHILDPEFARAGLCRLNPLQFIKRFLDPEPTTDFGKVAVLEACLYMRNQLLRDTDWASMRHSLEVRVPLVDVQVLRNVAPVAANKNETLSKSLLGRSPSAPLPQRVLKRSKTGFGTPLQTW